MWRIHGHLFLAIYFYWIQGTLVRFSKVKEIPYCKSFSKSCSYSKIYWLISIRLQISVQLSDQLVIISVQDGNLHKLLLNPPPMALFHLVYCKMSLLVFYLYCLVMIVKFILVFSLHPGVCLLWAWLHHPYSIYVNIVQFLILVISVHFYTIASKQSVWNQLKYKHRIGIIDIPWFCLGPHCDEY